MPAALAHAVVAPADLWRAWSFDPIVIVGSTVAAVAYGRGYQRLRRSRPFTANRRAGAFALALVALAAALVTPLDAVAETSFSAHMVQHLLLVVVAAPLLVVARPVRTALAGVRPDRRRWIARRGSIAAHPASRIVRHPGFAWIALTITLWAWHAPALYATAQGSTPVHVLEHATFLLTSVLAWSVVLGGRAGDSAGAFARVLFLLACAVQSGLLGALLLFAPSPLYPLHGGGPATWGLTPLEDQQLAGALMWVPPWIIDLGVAAVLLVGVLRPTETPIASRTVRAKVT